MKDSYSIAIIGPKNAILGFRALGLTTKFANTGEEAVKVLTELKEEKIKGEDNENRPKYAIIFIIERLMIEISREDYKKLSQDVLPAIVPVPGPQGSEGFGHTRLKRMVEQAVGSDIFGGN